MTTTAELSENSHQGFEGLKAGLCLASMEAKSNTASGLRGCLRREGTGSRCSGKERDETGLDYFGARYFSGALGRFISADYSSTPTTVPYADFKDPQTLNLYAYVRNNPLTKVDPDGHCPPDNVNCKDLTNNPLSSVSSDVKEAIKKSVENSNSKNTDDNIGGSHEEGGIAYTTNNKQIIAPSKPGPFKDVKEDTPISIDPFNAADPTKQKPGDVQADVVWHVHPKYSLTEISKPGVIGGSSPIGQTWSFDQEPSEVDFENSSPTPTLNLVIGARNKRVYVFDESGIKCEEKLNDFFK